MKYRHDITNFIRERINYFCKDYKIYEQDGLLYGARYFYENKNKIECYTDYNFVGVSSELKKMVEHIFNVMFANENKVICRCGEINFFSAHYGSYELILTCNKCGNEFTAYSG